MPEVTGSSPVGSTIRFLLSALIVSIAAHGSPSIRASLGWQGIPVVGAVNPLYVHITNADPTPLRGELQVSQRVGFPWRGWARVSLELEVLLPPGGKAAYLLPWPLAPGSRGISLRLRRGEEVLVEEEAPIPRMAGGLHGYLGPPPAAPAFPPVPLNTPDVSDPLLLSPFRALSYMPEILPAAAREAVKAWEAYLADRGRSFPPRAVLAEALGEIPLASRPLGAVAAGMTLYLVALGFALARYARTGDPRPCLAVLLVAAAASGAFSGLFMQGERAVEARWDLRDAAAPRFALVFAAVATQETTEWSLPGIRFELLPDVEGGWAGKDVIWRAGPEAATAFTVASGGARIFWGLEPRDPAPEGERYLVEEGGIRGPDGRHLRPDGFIRGAPRGLRPLLRWLLGRVSPGDALWIRAEKEVHGNYVRHRFAVYIERGT